jgi:hypothetical protein
MPHNSQSMYKFTQKKIYKISRRYGEEVFASRIGTRPIRSSMLPW